MGKRIANRMKKSRIARKESTDPQSARWAGWRPDDIEIYKDHVRYFSADSENNEQKSYPMLTGKECYEQNIRANRA